MQTSDHYPISPKNVPESLTQANSSYKRQAILAMSGLIFFMIFYLALMTCFAYITYEGVDRFLHGDRGNLFNIVATSCSFLLTLFMVKSLFAVRKAGNPGGIEVTAEQEPKLFNFLHNLSDEIGAPRPHRVFITPEVNAAVFYDLSLLNLIFPSKKNLVIGLGLVNVLNLGELKAVLAHEFGHFAQGSMVVGRWVYVAQQIIAHMVATRDWLDSVVRFISRIDLRIAWLGWILSLVIWSIRSMMDTLFSLVIIAERALSREMEFNADLVAVSVTGSDALVNALYKLQAADHAWQTALDVAGQEAESGKILDDIFKAQEATIGQMQRVLDDEFYGTVPPRPDDVEDAHHRVFAEETARPPQMWSTHPANSDREENAKAQYIAADIDERKAWEVFADERELRRLISISFYNTDKIDELEVGQPLEAVVQRFDRPSYSPEYRGVYLNRSPVRDFSSFDEMLAKANIDTDMEKAIAALYPASIADDLEKLRNLEVEKYTLEALASGDLKPSGGVIRHRGEEISKEEIPDAIEEISADQRLVSDSLMQQDANCRAVHLCLAQHAGKGWNEYLTALIKLLHCSEHLHAIVENEHSLLVNTWQVITADGQIGHFEKKRIIRVCNAAQAEMETVSKVILDMQLPADVLEKLGITDWSEQIPLFKLPAADKKNWPEWCQTASQIMSGMSGLMSAISAILQEDLILIEAKLRDERSQLNDWEDAPEPGRCPENYPVLLPGNEHVLQRKLDLWNRFQLAQGVFPTTARLLVSVGIVGGTIFAGLISLF
ncbi:M48 family metallopeptidase [Litoribrevibacter euphylliae]|uniref:M48 family metallopeptidase n=1 Tax=Litoribrevibacter euphylliae TaxID=1834034 RepID=A0ABV7HDD3_9GAMM